MKKVIAIVIVSFTILVLLGIKGYFYIDYLRLINNIKNGYDDSSIFTNAAIDVDIPVYEGDYFTYDKGWIEYQLPFTNETTSDIELGINGVEYYNYDEGKTPSYIIRLFNSKDYDSNLYDRDIIESINKYLKLDVVTDKDIMDALYKNDYNNINFFTSVSKTIEKTMLLSLRVIYTPYGEVYYFENENNKGYFFLDKSMLTARLVDNNGLPTAEFVLMSGSYDLVENFDVVKNILGSIKIK